jgi:DNA invertase Pin-like site-specific DNA recombinase
MQAEDETPIAGQLEECQGYAKSKGWEVVKVYKDEGFTGRNTDRPAFQQMMADAHQKPIPFEKIIVWKGSRIARNTEDRLACQSLLARKGIDIVSVKEPEFEGSIKILMLPIMAAIDEYQSYLIGVDRQR